MSVFHHPFSVRGFRFPFSVRARVPGPGPGPWSPSWTSCNISRSLIKVIYFGAVSTLPLLPIHSTEIPSPPPPPLAQKNLGFPASCPHPPCKTTAFRYESSFPQPHQPQRCWFEGVCATHVILTPSACGREPDGGLRDTNSRNPWIISKQKF